jgi:hypothetical protein
MRLFLLLARLLVLQHLLDDLLLLDQEGPHDAVTNAVTASRSTVGALNGLLGLGDLGVLAGSQGGNLCLSSISIQKLARPVTPDVILDFAGTAEEDEMSTAGKKHSHLIQANISVLSQCLILP